MSGSYLTQRENIGPTENAPHVQILKRLIDEPGPQNFRKLMKTCRELIVSNDIIGPSIYKIAQYGATDIIIVGENDIDDLLDNYSDKESEESAEQKQKLKKKKKIIERFKKVLKELNPRRMLLELGIDFTGSGNAILTPAQRFTRHLICKKTGYVAPIQNFKEYKWDMNKQSFEAKCPQCKSWHRFEVLDSVEKDKFYLVRWDLTKIDMETNPITQNIVYYYNPPSTFRKILEEGKPHKFLEETPLEILETASKNKKFILKDAAHLKRAAPNGFPGFGVPVILPAIRLLAFRELLFKEQEAIALDYILPLRVLFPTVAEGAVGDVTSNTDLRLWRQMVEKGVSQWRKDPLYILFLPFPIGQEQFGGNGNNMFVTPVLEFVTRQVIAAIGMPQDFHYGRGTFSGTLVNMRLFENFGANFNNEVERFLNDTLVPKLLRLMGVNDPDVEITLKIKQPKTADDLQKKTMLANLAAANKLSNTTLFKELGLNFKDEQANILRELKVGEKIALEQAKAAGKQQAASESGYKEEQVGELTEQMQAFPVALMLAKYTQQLLEMNREEATQQLKAIKEYAPQLADTLENLWGIATDSQMGELLMKARTTQEFTQLVTQMSGGVPGTQIGAPQATPPSQGVNTNPLPNQRPPRTPNSTI